MVWFDVLKMPIYNPMPAADESRALEIHPNNKMKPSEAKTFFQQAIDPYLEEAAEKNEVIVYIPLERLEMESHIAMGLIEDLYPVDDYEDIWIDHQGKNIVFDMTHEGTKPQKDPKPPSNSHWGAGGA